MKELLAQINPPPSSVPGWMDLRITAPWPKPCNRIPVVLTLDNWWTGSLKQRLADTDAPRFIKRRFNRAWVPGAPKSPSPKNWVSLVASSLQDFTAPTLGLFQAVYERRKSTPTAKKLLCRGATWKSKACANCGRPRRTFRGIPNWELYCVGTGDLWEERMIHPKIFHHGFKQPYELAPFLEDAACFVMPSKKEPWGVVLHEMAIAGLPLIASKNIGSATAFLKNRRKWICH